MYQFVYCVCVVTMPRDNCARCRIPPNTPYVLLTIITLGKLYISYRMQCLQHSITLYIILEMSCARRCSKIHNFSYFNLVIGFRWDVVTIRSWSAYYCVTFQVTIFIFPENSAALCLNNLLLTVKSSLNIADGIILHLER